MSQQQQQPVEVLYPIVVTRKPTSSNSHGSFVHVYIVLGVIIAMSAVACVVGRLCIRRFNHRPKAKKQPSHGLGPKEWEAMEQPMDFNMMRDDHDHLESGYERRIPTARVAENGGVGEGKPPQGHITQVRFADNNNVQRFGVW